MGRHTEIAKNVAGLSGEYLSIDAVIATYPEGVTVNGVSLRAVKDGESLPCLTFTEDSTKYFYAVSGDLGKIYAAWMREYEGNVDVLNEELGLEHLKLKLEKIRTKTNKTYVKVRFIGTERVQLYEQVDTDTGEVTLPF